MMMIAMINLIINKNNKYGNSGNKDNNDNKPGKNDNKDKKDNKQGNKDNDNKLVNNDNKESSQINFAISLRKLLLNNITKNGISELFDNATEKKGFRNLKDDVLKLIGNSCISDVK